MSDILLEEQNGPYLVLTLNDPERANPLSPAMVSALDRALAGGAENRSVRAVILAGAGRHFSAGADLAALEQVVAGDDQEANRNDSRRLEQMFAGLLGHPKLTIAAVEGAAIGGGCGLATACDFVVASRAARFSYTEVKIGFIPALVSTFLTRRVTGQVARKLMLDPEIVDGESAVSLGLADNLAEPGNALESALQLAESICSKASPSALAATKGLLNQAVGLDWRGALELASEANVRQRSEPECRLGVRTFLERKTTPDWLVEGNPRDDSPDREPRSD